MTTAADDGWESEYETPEIRDRRQLLVDLGLGTATGLLAGMAGIAYAFEGHVALQYPSGLFLWILVAAGVFAFVVVPTLRRAVIVGLVGYAVGTAVIVGTFVAPAYLLPFEATFRDLLVPRLVGDAISVILMVYSPTYLGGYLTAMCVVSFQR